jgi:hypothetical protein
MGRGVVEVKDIAYPKLELDSTKSPVVSERQRRTRLRLRLRCACCRVGVVRMFVVAVLRCGRQV